MQTLSESMSFAYERPWKPLFHRDKSKFQQKTVSYIFVIHSLSVVLTLRHLLHSPCRDSKVSSGRLFQRTTATSRGGPFSAQDAGPMRSRYFVVCPLQCYLVSFYPAWHRCRRRRARSAAAAGAPVVGYPGCVLARIPQLAGKRHRAAPTGGSCNVLVELASVTWCWFSPPA
ncbi:hypothetical protein TPHA_0N00150 [Tetrapisispora phaffii CBS 4417]|uniref:Uncharacterized protein n=1 Tax=Tetrapisispora phaffii (strain ATCC 24235 / CBS 4417 / NBRC 1672 / NRRL Y-8282 / UCD 70-5) TaxID=1071381 RepID=G8C0W8_TETPH|nr:hypothetical protein TPHA_0N00150 [Tetrapisispora phaffii CBS 4417]CCE65796.1 hypothetical protein TPHA_0N00150 [Tetrapisispora phaffii CBS 4417]